MRQDTININELSDLVANRIATKTTDKILEKLLPTNTVRIDCDTNGSQYFEVFYKGHKINCVTSLEINTFLSRTNRNEKRKRLRL